MYVSLFFGSHALLTSPIYTVIHPYYKLKWIEHHWGGAEAQAEEILAGNFGAKNWIDEAEKLVEKTVSTQFSRCIST